MSKAVRYRMEEDRSIVVTEAPDEIIVSPYFMMEAPSNLIEIRMTIRAANGIYVYQCRGADEHSRSGMLRFVKLYEEPK